MPAGESEARAKTRARFDEVLKRYTDPPSEKKKSKKRAEPEESIVLETLKKKLDLNKDTDDDRTVFNNTYHPDQGSPRYIKNKLREKVSSEKVNNNNSPVQEVSKLSSGKKRTKRDLPRPPSEDVLQTDEKDAGGARISELRPVPEADGEAGKKPRRSRKGTDKAAEVRREDELLQEYQQQIAQEEEKATKRTFRRKTAEMKSDTDQVVALNNHVGKKKKKKLRSLDSEVEERSVLAELRSSQSDEAGRKWKPKTISSDAEVDGPGEQEVDVDEQMERVEALKQRGKRKKKGKKEVTEDVEADIEGPQKRVFDDSLVLGVYIHRTDQLKTDLLVLHPMVKVHVVDEVTGQYVKKEDGNRPVSSFYEQENVEHILPIMTQPFDFKKNKSTVPEWEEQIVFNERFGYFLQNDDESPRVMLFFEILDFISMDEARANTEVDRRERGFRKIAWAFLKLVGTNGVLNVDSKLRLQLYSPPPRAKKQPSTVEVVEWWRRFPRSRYTSTLYVTVKGLRLPEHVDPSIRSMMALQQERGSTSYNELQSTIAKKSTSQHLESGAEVLRWSRLPGQVCRIPNKPMLSLRGGQMGCFTMCFSHGGRRLAAACVDRDAFPIVVYEIPTGKVLAAFNGHLSIVYDLCWSRDDQNLLSASSDGTVRIWDVESLQSLAKKILPHPSFVYSAQYHPFAQDLVATGGYDCVIRVWNVNVRDINGQLLHEFEGHKAFINALCFDLEGLRLFSGDNAGLILMWNTPVGESSQQRLIQQWNVEKEMGESDLKGIPINTLEVHPNGRRLLINAKDSVVRVMDLRVLAVKKFTGATNYRERIHSTFTPCGSFIFSGSEDGMAYVWNAETGDRVAVYSELCYPSPLRDVAFHPHEHMAAFCAFGENQPIHIYIYDRKVSQMEVESMKSMNKSNATDAKRNVLDLAAFRDTPASGMDHFASAARASLKMLHVQQKLDSVLNSHRNRSVEEYLHEQGGASLGRELGHESGMLFNTVGSNRSLPAPSLLSPHSKLCLPGSHSAQLIPQASLASHTGRFSPVGQRFSRSPSLRLQTSIGDPSWSSVRVEADSFVPVQQTVVSLYDYSANRSDELTVYRGDIIQVLYKDNDNWWFGRLTNGQQGYFPANYVADQSDFEEELSHAIEADKAQLNQSAERSTPTKMSATISASGELRFISEHDTDSEATTSMVQKKKRVKKSASPATLVQTATSDPEVPSTSMRKKKQKANAQLQKKGLSNSAFELEP